VDAPHTTTEHQVPQIRHLFLPFYSGIIIDDDDDDDDSAISKKELMFRMCGFKNYNMPLHQYSLESLFLTANAFANLMISTSDCAVSQSLSIISKACPKIRNAY
jgi:hypothetical protein